MNEKSAKLAILGGFGVRVFISLLNIIRYTQSNMIFLNRMLNAAAIIATLVIVAGFAMLYMLNQDTLDIVICIGAGGALLNSLMVTLLNSGIGYSIYSYVSLVSGLMVIIGMGVWAYKMYKNQLTTGAAAIVLGLVLSIASGMVGIYIISYVISIACTASYAYAAYIEYNN